MLSVIREEVNGGSHIDLLNLASCCDLRLNNTSSVSGRGPQVMALMDCHKHEPWDTGIGSDAAFLSAPALLGVQSFFGKTVLAIIFMAELVFFMIQFMLPFLVSNYFSLLHLHLGSRFKSPVVCFFSSPIHCFLGNLSCLLNTYTICSLDLLAVPKQLYLTFALRIATEIVMSYLSFMHHQP